ncbi:MAG: hypothetical protein V7731_21115 [Amphritea sp.]
MASQNIYLVAMDVIPASGAHNLDQYSKAKVAAFIRNSTPRGIESIVAGFLAEAGWQVISCNGVYGPTTPDQIDVHDSLQQAFESATEEGFSAVIIPFPATIH